MKHLYLATPTYTQTVTIGFCQSLQMTMVACTKAGIVMSGPRFKGGPYIHDNRNFLVHCFMRSGADTLLFVDDDVTWDEKAVVDLYESGYDVCGGAYPKKQDDETYPVQLLANAEGRYRECLFLPGGFLMIRRTVFEQMGPLVDNAPWPSFNNESVPEFFQNAVHHGGTKMGEDIEFCRRWRAMGNKVWCLPDIDFEHQGPKAWAGNLSRFLPPLYEVEAA